MSALENPDDILLVVTPNCKLGRFLAVASYGDASHRDVISLDSETARARFIRGALRTLLPIDIAKRDRERFERYLDGQLIAYATVPPGAPTTVPEMAEVDVRHVVRPELFHTASVSGITVPIVLDGGGKLLPQWRTFLRWADGRREAVDLPDRLILPDCTTLYIAPDPGEPSSTDPPAWSAHSRRDWIEGTAPPEPRLLFRQVCEQFERFLDFAPETGPGTIATLALWTMLSYVYPAWDAVPYLYVGGPMSSGKSRVLDVLQRLVFRPVSSSNLTAPTLFRTLHATGGTMLLDEAERLRQSTPEQVELQSVFLAGYRRGGCTTRLELVDDCWRPTRFAVFGLKALACIAGLPPTLASRCIQITMFRSAGDSEKPKRRIDSDPAAWQAIRDSLHFLALEYGPVWVDLASRSNVVPPGIGGRNYELWQPLLALAAWLQEQGADGLLKFMHSVALASIANAKDDAMLESDEVLLELLAESVRERRSPTTGELLAAAKLRDEVTFKMWHPKTVSSRLKTYGIQPPAKVSGERRYNVTPAQILRIQERYGVDLGMG